MRAASDPITELRRAIDCLPVRTREAMLEGIRTNQIVVGAYTDSRGGICPMLAAHRNGGRTTFLAFARAWDRFAGARKPRLATRRELRTLEDLLVTSLMKEEHTDLGAAIQDHLASVAARREREQRRPREIVARRLGPGRVRSLRAVRTESDVETPLFTRV